MNLYDVVALEQHIDRIAEENEGEIPDELLQQLVEAEMQSLVKVENICKYLKHLDMFAYACKKEEERISHKRKMAENTIARFKAYMTPYVLRDGKVDAGTFRLSTRKSERVELDDGFDNPDFCNQEMVITPDKNRIKEALKAGEQVEGARIIEVQNLQIK